MSWCRKERTRLLLVVAPTKIECHRTAVEFGLDFLKVDRMRFISNAYHLRGWSRGTAFIAHADQRSRWPEALDLALTALTLSGQLRIAGERDLAELRDEIGGAA